MAAFRNNALDITFIGITADRAEVMQGPTVIDLQTTYVVPAASKIASIEESTSRACSSWCRSAALRRRICARSSPKPLSSTSRSRTPSLLVAGRRLSRRKHGFEVPRERQ